MTWEPESYGEGLRMAWDEPDDGVDHCLTKIEPHLPESGVVVDIGCGVGRLTIPLAHRWPRLTFCGYDTSTQMLEMAHEQDTERRVHWIDRLGPYLHGAFSVLTFQHIDDYQVREYLELLAPRPFVFQFVEGTEREPLSMQRDGGEVMQWCWDAGFSDVRFENDDRFENWRWMYAR